MKRTIWATGLALGLLCWCAAPARAQQGLGGGVGLDNPIPQQALGEATAPAPNWVAEGVRLNYQVRGSAFDFGQEVVAEQLVQVDLTAVTNENVAGTLALWQKGNDGSLVFMQQSGWASATGGQLDGFWLHPVYLQRIAEAVKQGGGQRGLDVQVGPWAEGEEGQQVVRVQADTQAMQVVVVYDLATGILLDQAVGDKVGGQLRERARVRLIDMRQRKLPWIEGRPPSWLFKFRQMRYDGSLIQAYPNGQQQQAPLASDVQFLSRGKNWVSAQVTVSINGQAAAQLVGVSGPSGVGGFWLPPLGLRDLRQGEVVDRDPHTKMVTSIEFVGQGNHGRQIVTIKEEAPGFKRQMDYEQSTGVMLLATWSSTATNQSFQMYFTGIR